MATRRCLKFLTDRCASFLSSNPSSFQTLKSLNPHFRCALIQPFHRQFRTHSVGTSSNPRFGISRRFCKNQGGGNSDDESEVESDDFVECDDDDGEEEEKVQGVPNFNGFEMKQKEAAEIGYEVIGPLRDPKMVFKPYEPVFAVVQVGSHQFKVSNGDSIYTEKLKYCHVNEKLILKKVLMLGSRTQTIIGRPILPDAAVHCFVEEHALDAKVIIFKKKRRKNYRRKNGHRQELTKLRITDILGIEKPENLLSGNSKTDSEKVEKVAVAA